MMPFSKYGLHHLLPGSVFGVVIMVVLAVWIVKEVCDSVLTQARRSGIPQPPASEDGFSVELEAPWSWLRLFRAQRTGVSILSPDRKVVGQWETFEPEDLSYLIHSMSWKTPTCLSFYATACSARVLIEQADPKWRVTEISEENGQT